MPRRAPLLAALAAAVTLIAAPVPVHASMRIGSNLLSMPTSAGVCSAMDCTVVNLALPGSNQAPDGIVSPANGVVSNWSYRSGAPSAQPIRLRVLHPAGGLSFTGAGTTPSVPVFGGIRGLFSANLPIEIGDYIALDANGAQVLATGVAGALQGSWTGPPLADGSTRGATASPGVETMVQVTIQPTNAVRFGAIKRRKTKGTATVAVAVPNAGSLSYTGVGARVTGPAAIAGPGQISVSVKARGKKLRRLNKKGTAHVQPQIVFTPVLGDVGTTVEKLKLIKKRRSTP
jgi:hypothetical protein